MAEHIGLWIDHRKAVLVKITDEGVCTTQRVPAKMKHVRFSESTTAGGSAEDTRDRHLANHLHEYYDRVVAVIHRAASIQVFGPGEAKGELVKRIEHAGLEERIVGVEAADRMTDRQIEAKVREHCLA